MQLTTQLAGRKIVEVWRNGVSLVIRCEDGFELQVGWKDPDTGNPVNGEPVIVFAGKRIRQAPRTFVQVPHRREVGL